jgi:hypothetical protein
MVLKRPAIYILLFSAFMANAAVTIADVVENIEWRDLIPPEMTREMVQQGTIKDSSIKFGQRYDLSYFPMVKSLDGKAVRMLGFALPLEFEGTEIREFLLVPYVGACIHVPPPLPNQIVHVVSVKGFVSDGLFTPVWVTGVMHTRSGAVNLDFVDGSENVQVGYFINAGTVEIFRSGK